MVAAVTMPCSAGAWKIGGDAAHCVACVLALPGCRHCRCRFSISYHTRWPCSSLAIFEKASVALLNFAELFNTDVYMFSKVLGQVLILR